MQKKKKKKKRMRSYENGQLFFLKSPQIPLPAKCHYYYIIIIIIVVVVVVILLLFLPVGLHMFWKCYT